MTQPIPDQPTHNTDDSAHDADQSDHAGDLPIVWPGLDSVAGGDVVAGDPPVPITVWRALPGEATEPAAGGLATWLARRLVATYSRPGRTVVDFDDDPPLRHAAVAGRRHYVPLPAAGDLADLDRHPTAVDLITFRWPRTTAGTPASTAAVADLFRACRMLSTPGGHTAVIVPPPAPAGQVSYVEHSRQLVPAARTAGMGYLQHIIAVLAPIVGDTLQPPPQRLVDPAGGEVRLHQRAHLDLLIFIVTGRSGRG